MIPTDFYSIVLPLGVLIVILVSLAFYLARKGDTYNKELKKLMRARTKQEKIIAEELEKLQTLLDDKSIDQDTYVRLRKLLEMSLTRRLKRLNAQARAA